MEEHGTRLIRKPAVDDALAMRIALFAVMLRHPRAESVLNGLSLPLRECAKNVLADTANRHARITFELGHRHDQNDRVAQVVAEAPPPLRKALWLHMTPAQQARFPHLAGGSATPAMCAFAERLIHEATR
jgi:hypothetical protein